MAINLSLGDTTLLIDTCEKYGLSLEEAAYVLATAYHETAHTMKPVTEFGSEEYLRSKPYYPFIGRGYVQVTWRANYEKVKKLLGIDCVTHPSLLNDPKYAAPVIVVGMKNGWFTGRKLSDYFRGREDAVNARQIVNGMDAAYLIDSYYDKYHVLLRDAKYSMAHINVDNPIPEPYTPVLGFWGRIKGWFFSILRYLQLM